MAKNPAKSASNGGNGGYNRRKAVDAGFSKPLATSNAMKASVTGKFIDGKTQSGRKK